jgi:hypothetical protein
MGRLWLVDEPVVCGVPWFRSIQRGKGGGEKEETIADIHTGFDTLVR